MTNVKQIKSHIQNKQETYQQHWVVDFSKVEPLLFTLELTSENHLVIDEVLLEVLNRLYSQGVMPEKQVQRERLYFLISRTLPPPANRKFVDTLNRYWSYKLALENIEQPTLASSTKTPLETLIKRQSLQTLYFGELDARLLFSKTNNTHAYLIKRKLIIENPSLSDSEKTRSLTWLKTAYENQKIL